MHFDKMLQPGPLLQGTTLLVIQVVRLLQTTSASKMLLAALCTRQQQIALQLVQGSGKGASWSSLAYSQV